VQPREGLDVMPEKVERHSVQCVSSSEAARGLA
jgi:hypothetical protein